MRKLVMALAFAVPSMALAATWNNVPLVDHACADKVKADPDSHPVSCALTCEKSGYGILEEGKWIPLDKEGNHKALAALKATHRKDHIRANISGELKGSVIHVSTLSIPD
jgi:hypothetical protein